MGGASYFFRMYDIKGDRPAVATRLGNSFPGDGVKFAGRGYVQITGRANYTDWGKRLDLPLTAQPDLALEPDVAAVILLDGMEYGTFTSRRLSAYFNDTTNDAINARRIVNGVDKAELIAGYHNKFLAALEAARIAPAPEEVLVAPKSLEERVAALESDVVELKRMLTNGV
jgi:putative chitinase